MRVNTVASKAFEVGCRSYLAMAMFCCNDEDDFIDTKFGVEDCAEETLAFVAGEVLAAMRKVQAMGLLDRMRAEDIDVLMGGVAGEACRSGVSVTDKFIYGLHGDDIVSVQSWIVRRWGTRTLDLYVGDDGKLYVEGFERKKPIRIKMSISQDPGRFGAMHEFTMEAVTPDVVAVQTMRMIHEEGWVKTWMKGYEEIPT